MALSESKHPLDEQLRRFYDRHNVAIQRLWKDQGDAGALAGSPFRYRFVRLNPRFPPSETLEALRRELKGAAPLPVGWLPDEAFYAVPAGFSLAASESFRSGRVYGMDVSSGAGVAALLSRRFDQKDDSCDNAPATAPLRVLDLCCCPGLKLCVLADGVPKGSTVVGVDVSEHRMALCQKIVRKYHIDRSTSGRDAATGSTRSEGVTIQLYCQDGTTFGAPSAATDTGNPSCGNLVFDSRVALEEEESRGNRKRKNKSARARERKRLKQLAASELLPAAEGSAATEAPGSQPRQDPPPGNLRIPLFDRVLVDAECSTDGSLKHVVERLKAMARQASPADATGVLPANQMLTDEGQLADLLDLQRRLVASGFRLLKEGGTLVYSTCSLSRDQNEDIVRWLLDQEEDARLVPVHFPLAKSANQLVVEGSIPGTVRFYPNLDQDDNALFGDGFFLAKITKQAPAQKPNN